MLPRPIMEKYIPGQYRRHIGSRRDRGPRRTSRAHRRSAEMAVDQNPIADHVDKIRRDQRKHDRPHAVGRLQIAPQGGVDQKRR